MPYKMQLCAMLFIGIFFQSCYALRQAYHQNNLFNSRQPISEVLHSPDTDARTRSQLELVSDVMKSASAAGLNTKGAYTYFIDLPGGAVSHIVQAAHVDRLEFKTWWFPVVGRVPYLGYFSQSERDAKATELAAKNYDVNEAQVGAFSSLGWFEDPVYSSMLRRRPARLAHLLFHELTHRTVWVRGSTLFNENLAEFVAFELTEDFLQSRGAEEELANYQAFARDNELFKQWLRSLRRELTRFYRTNRGQSRESILQARTSIFDEFRSKGLPSFATPAFDFVGAREWNNASVLGASLYSPEIEPFKAARACYGEKSAMGDFLRALHRRAKRMKDADRALESFCWGAS